LQWRRLGECRRSAPGRWTRADEPPVGSSRAIRQLIGLVAIPCIILRVSTALIRAWRDVLRFDSTEHGQSALADSVRNNSCIDHLPIPLPVESSGIARAEGTPD
jgi:hypothetical protein